MGEYYYVKSRNRYMSRCKTCDRAASAERHKNVYSKDKDLQRAKKLKSRYGLSVEDFENILDAQNNKCAICNESLNGGGVVDHCHTSGKVRGILCRTCNIGLGHFRDNEDFLNSAIKYLKVY
ncbi:putative integration and excision endonuclease VII [Salmonella phage PKM.Hi.22.6]|nr:putative integration and excision endonuclease VII [Salmonella phage PKM.Hi.22.6]